jgi:hypothetical protein
MGFLNGKKISRKGQGTIEGILDDTHDGLIEGVSKPLDEIHAMQHVHIDHMKKKTFEKF